MNLQNVRESALRVIHLLDDYSGGHVGSREMLLDPVLYGYLQGRFGHITRQHHVRPAGSSRPRRIDFRSGTSNPVVIEFAVRPPSGVGSLTGSQNRSELQKLCRVRQSAARLRVLLLIDLFSRPMTFDGLKETYDSENSGPGRFTRHSVRVIYVHRGRQFDFLWRP